MSVARSIILSSVIAAVVDLTLLCGCAPGTTNLTGLTGDATNGQAILNQRCASCHRTGGAAAPLTAADADNVVTNLGSISLAMAGITLTNQQVADLRAFLATQ
jgi:mono/diheme cytochrome c family protein